MLKDIPLLQIPSTVEGTVGCTANCAMLGLANGTKTHLLTLEGGSFRVGLEDWTTGPSNVEQIERAKKIIGAVGRPIVTGAEAIEYLDIPFAATRPSG